MKGGIRLWSIDTLRYSQGQKYVNMAEILLHFGANPGLTTTYFRILHKELISLLCANFQS